MKKSLFLLPLIALMCGCGEITVEFNGEDDGNGESTPSDAISSKIIYETSDGLPIERYFRSAYYEDYHTFGDCSCDYESEVFGSKWVEDKEVSGKREMIFSGPITHIGKQAFARNERLMKMTLPSLVERIDEAAFANCKKLISIELPSNMKKIGNKAFEGCESLIEINLPEDLREIGSYAFAESGLRKIDIKTQVNTIEAYAFSGCNQLTEVVLGDGIKWMDGYVFSGCPLLSSITLPESVLEIGDGVFVSCEKIDIYVKALTPPRIPVQSKTSAGSWSGLISYENYESVNVYVPAESIEAYRASNWGVYNLIEYDFNEESNNDGNEE